MSLNYSFWAWKNTMDSSRVYVVKTGEVRAWMGNTEFCRVASSWEAECNPGEQLREIQLYLLYLCCRLQSGHTAFAITSSIFFICRIYYKRKKSVHLRSCSHGTVCVCAVFWVSECFFFFLMTMLPVQDCKRFFCKSNAHFKHSVLARLLGADDEQRGRGSLVSKIKACQVKWVPNVSDQCELLIERHESLFQNEWFSSRTQLLE